MNRVGEEFEILVVANPSWERAWLVSDLPVDSFDPSIAQRRTADGGGSALNTACALARAGRRVAAVGRVGDDAEGRLCVEALARRGVHAKIEIAPGRATKRNDLFVRSSDRATAFRATIPPHTAPAWEEDPPALLAARLLHLDRLAAASIDWCRRRRARGMRNSLNLNAPMRRSPGTERFCMAAPLLDFIQIPESADATRNGPDRVAPPSGSIHSPMPSPPLTGEEIASILEGGSRVLIRTRGADGVRIDRVGVPTIHIPARPTEVVDPTGAGDAFAAGWIDAILEGAGDVAAASRGVDWAARACRHLGARAWLDHEPPEVA